MQVSRHRRAATFQVEGHRHAQLLGDVVAQLVVGGIRPDDRFRTYAQFLFDALHAAAEIVAQALLVLLRAFIALRRRVVDAGDHRRGLVALRVGLHAVVQVVGMAGQFDQAAGLHLAQLVPGQEIVMAERTVAVVDGAARCHVHVVGDHRHQRRIVVRTQQWIDTAVHAAQAVVEGQQHRPRRQFCFSARGLDQLRQRDRVIAMGGQPVQVCGEVLRADRVGVGIGLLQHIIAHVVIAEDQQAVVGRVQFRGRAGALGCGGQGEEQQRQQQYGRQVAKHPSHLILPSAARHRSRYVVHVGRRRPVATNSRRTRGSAPDRTAIRGDRPRSE
ncbi:hypothetical protein D3C73_882880 [compost metagenome]